MKRAANALGLAALATLLGQWGPMVTSVAPLRRRALPGLSGISPGRSIALTYDDGPDPASTPLFLDLLDRHQVSATFFLLGAFVETNASLVREMTAAGHELAVHGWDHQCLAWKRPGQLGDQIYRTKATIEDLTGVGVRWFRPPYGVMTGEGLIAAHRAGLNTVLWSAWGRDWSSRATADSIVRQIDRDVEPGGTILLHDTDRTSSPSSWRRTLSASDRLLEQWRDSGVPVRTVSDHLAGTSVLSHGQM